MLSESKEEFANGVIESQKENIKLFIDELQKDLELLKGENYQRHKPDYYDEREYYNWFHRYIPQALLMSDAYNAFIHYYNMGKNLYDSVNAFIREARRLFYVDN